MIEKTPYTAIVLSGLEGDRFMDTVYNFAGCRHGLISVFYVEQKGTKWFQERVKKYPDVRWTVDSGGHSFRTEGFCPKWPDWNWFDDFSKRYRDWLLENRDIIDLAVNLDVDCLDSGGKGVLGHGFAKMLEYDEEIFRPLERAGVPVCYVWHEGYGYDYWLKLCREHEYVGLPGTLQSDAEYHKMLRPAMMNGCRVHGFACTKASLLGKVPFASADSTTWKSGERFGQTFVFESSKLNVYDHNNKEIRQRYKAQWVAKGVDWDLLEQDKAEAISQVAAIAWGQLQDHIKTMSGKLAYWLKASRLADDLGDPEKTDPAAVNKLMADVGCPIRVDNQSDAVGCLEELQWILGRHPEVMSMSDENLDWWVEQINAEPENTTRVEKEAAVRQTLYQWFYKINAQEAKSREASDVEPVLKVKGRPTEPPDVEADVPELPDSPSVLIPESTPAITMIDHVPREEDNPVYPNTDTPVVEGETVVDTGFIDATTDRIQRSRATLALDLIFEQFKLRHEADLLKNMRVRKRRMQECRRQANALAAEITSHTDSLDPTLAEKVRSAAQEMFDQWIALQQDETQEQLAKQREVLAQRPQNRALAERASEIGRMGGAPKGNQNARKHGLSSKKMPALACDNCPHIQVCPQYRAGHVCAFIAEFEAPLVAEEDEEPQVAAVRQILEAQVKRSRRALLYETFEGGIINKQTSTVLSSAMSAAKMYHDMKHPAVSGFGGRQLAAPEEAAKGGFLEKIFGDLAAHARDAESTPVGDNDE